jgi:hypothetical protein
VIEPGEQTTINQIVRRLTCLYPSVPQDAIASVVHDVYARFDGRPLRDYIPLLVERSAKTELNQLQTSGEVA